MSKVQMLRALVDQRLNAAVEEILELFETTLAQCEAELTQSQQKNLHLRDLLRAILNPEVRLQRAVFPEDIQQLLVQQKWSPCLDQLETKPPQVKEEQEILWTSQQGEGLEETDVTKFSFTVVSLKSENDEDNAQSLQLHQRQTDENTEKEPLSRSSPEQTETEAGVDHCGAPESVMNLGPLQPVSDDKASDSSESNSEVSDDDDDWKESRKPRSTLNTSEKNGVCVSLNTGKKSFSCTECGATLKHKFTLKRHMQIHTGEKPCSCSICGKSFIQVSHLKIHMRVHTGEKPYSCSVCGKNFSLRANLKVHMRVHTGEKSFNCSICSKNFSVSVNLKQHMRIHTAKKPFSCSICGKNFTQSATMKRHIKIHTDEKPFSCSICGKKFIQSATLKRHSKTHTAEKPFRCSICGKSFTRRTYEKKHMRTHTGETPLNGSLSVKSV